MEIIVIVIVLAAVALMGIGYCHKNPDPKNDTL